MIIQLPWEFFDLFIAHTDKQSVVSVDPRLHWAELWDGCCHSSLEINRCVTIFSLARLVLGRQDSSVIMAVRVCDLAYLEQDYSNSCASYPNSSRTILVGSCRTMANNRGLSKRIKCGTWQNVLSLYGVSQLFVFFPCVKILLLFICQPGFWISWFGFFFWVLLLCWTSCPKIACPWGLWQLSSISSSLAIVN